jgi:hypothetical protein
MAKKAKIIIDVPFDMKVDFKNALLSLSKKHGRNITIKEYITFHIEKLIKDNNYKENT